MYHIEVHLMNKNTVSSLSQKEAELVARLSYEGKDIVTAKDPSAAKEFGEKLAYLLEE